MRYLSRQAVESGDAEERARADYKRSRQRRDAEAALPQAWANLAAERGRLADLLAAEVESVSGYQPDAADVAAFLASLRPEGGPLPPPTPPVPEPPLPPEREPDSDNFPISASNSVAVSRQPKMGATCSSRCSKRWPTAPRCFSTASSLCRSMGEPAATALRIRTEAARWGKTDD